MKKVELMIFFLVVVMATLLHKATAQSSWVIGAQIWVQSSCPGPMTVKVYNTKGTPSTMDDDLLATTSFPTGDNNMPYSEVMISLPNNFDINQMQVTGQASCDSKAFYLPYYNITASGGAYWFSIVPGGGTPEGQWEFQGELYQFTSPEVFENCDVVTISLPTHISTFGLNNTSHVSWKITDGPNSTTIDTYNTDGITVTTAQMKAWFGSSFQLLNRYTVVATDENLPPQQSPSFRMRSAPPHVDFNSISKICETSGHLDVIGSSINVSPDVPEIQINNYQPVLTGDLATLSIPLDVGTYRIQVFNYNSSDAEDNCYTEYFDTSTPERVGPSKTIVDGSYSLSLFATPSPKLSCYGNSNGSIDLTVNNGSTPFSYSWSSGQSSQDISGISAGTYNVNVSDVNQCTGSVNSISIDQQPPLGVPSASVTSGSLPNHNGSAISCASASDGQITFDQPSGGSGSYEYSIDGGSAYQSSNVFSNLPAVTYSIMIRDVNDASCTKAGSSNITINNPSAIVPGTASALCSGASNNTITISGASGGSGSLSWSIGGTYQSVSTPFMNVPPNSYSITVSDVNGCTASAGTITVNAPITASYTSSNASCATVNDGMITVTNAMGGTSAFHYSLNSGGYQSGNSFSNLSSGSSYSINVKDDNTGCVFTINDASVGIITPGVSGTITQTSFINCFGQSTAAFNVIGSGGTTSYTNYSWSNGVSGTSVSNVGAGIYAVTITDSKGCQGTGSISINQPPQLIATPTPSNFNGYNISCKGGNNGSISLAPSGGTPGTSPPYTYSWTNASWSLPKTTQNISGLSKGSYSVMVTDSKACTATTSITMTEPPTAISVLFQTKNDVTCFGFNDGSITVSGTGGVGAMHYKDSTATSASAYQLSNNLVSLAADTYFIRAKDANGCVGITPGVIIDTPTALSITEITKTDPDCAGAATGSLQVTATGGTPPYQYSNNGGTLSSSSTFSPLASVLGGYIISVQDANSCNTLSTAQELTDPPALTVSATSVSESYDFAGDGKINVTASGGTGTIMYSKDGIAFQSGAAFDNLSGGLYTITVKDEHNCIQTADAFVASTPPPPSSITCSSGQLLSVSVTNQIDPTCGLPNGSTQVTATGGSGTFSFQWLDALGRPAGTDASLQSISSGTYNVRVTDSNNCLVGTSVTLAPYTATQFSVININSALCSNSVDGSASMQVTSGQAPYTQVWSSGETTTAASKLPGGQNTITVTDGNGCNVTKTFQVPSPLAITAVKETIINPVCTGGSDGSIQVLATGGTGVLSYTWNGTAGSNVIQNVKEGTYNLIIKDGNNCMFTKSYSIVDPTRFTIDLGTDETICPNTDTQIGLTLPNATYVWSGPNGFSSSQGIISVSQPGSYQLSVIDSIGCQASDQIVLTISNNLLKADFLTTSVASVGDSIILIDISWPLPDKIQWELGDSTTVISTTNDYALISFDKPGTYNVGMTASLGGCQDIYFQTITIDEKKTKTGGREAASAAILDFLIYPNPFSVVANFQIELDNENDVTMKVYSMVTNMLIMSHQLSGQNKYTGELDFSGREQGLFVVIIEVGSVTKAIRVIKL